VSSNLTLSATINYLHRNASLPGVLYWHCCYRLSLLGWNVMPTARNARGVDIIAYSGDASRFIGVQVKALSKRSPVPLGLSLDKCMGDFWIIVTKATSEPATYILTPSEVRANAHRGEKDGRCLTGCNRAVTSNRSSRKPGTASGKVALMLNPPPMPWLKV
jgi:hypothetical protein